MKSDQKMNQQLHNSNQPICKKIQNYIFKFTDILGQGNFSKVYKAHHELTNQIVAVKIIELNSLKSQKLQQLLFSEIDVLKKLSHPNVLRCFEVFTSNRNCYIITEICNGGDLQTKLRREHHFSEQSAQPIIKDIFSGLLYLAQKNVIHRDLKVANVFLHNGRAKIADFGFAKFTKQNFKDINIGSPIYMAPQGLIHNIYGPKTDVWAFGILMFELLHGETPFAHCRTEAQLKYTVSMPITQKKLRPQLSPEIRQVIMMCLQTDEVKRVTAFDLQKHPFFRRLMEKSPLRRMDSPVIEKKYSTASQKYVGASNNSSSQQIIKKYNFLASRDQQPINSLKQTYQYELPKKSLSPVHIQNRDQTSNNLGRGFSTQKNIFNYRKSGNNNIPEELRDISQTNTTPNKFIPSGSSKVFSIALTFKECVNLLHYCRLIYKFVISMKQTQHSDENLAVFLSAWVLSLMDQIKIKINDNGIIYEGQNAWLREKKLREVTNEYTKKYRQQLMDTPGINTSLSLVLSQARQYYAKVDTQITKGNERDWVIQGHYIVMIAYSTHLIRKCYNEQNYKPLAQYKQIEQFLNKNKDYMDIQSYWLLRKKMSFIQ